jgi:hypothetical protein
MAVPSGKLDFSDDSTEDQFNAVQKVSPGAFHSKGIRFW